MVDRRRNSSTTGALQRAAIACQSCRLRKVKCDAQSVSSDQGCSPCRRAGQECFFDPLSDGRRSVSVKFVDNLQQRIQTLEALNQGTLNPSAWRPNENSAVAGPPADTPVLPCSQSTAQRVNTPNTGPTQTNDTADPVLPSIPYTSHRSLPASNTINGASPRSTRVESPSFYGPTSHLHVVSPGGDSLLTPNDDVDAVAIDLDANSPHLRDHLFRSFFKYQTLWVDIVDKETFLHHQANGSNSRWYSKFLENAMLACSTRLSTSKSVRALGSKYCEWVKDEGLRAMSEPTPANLQGFLLLSEYEVTQGNDRPGWMFCGVACRMLSGLGLHELACILGPRREAREPTKESDLAYALLSACIVYEGVWTLYLGRPSSIPASVMNNAASRCRARQHSDSPWLNAWVGLCVPMAQVSHVLNEQSISDSDRFDSLRRLFRQVEEWYEGLPPELTYDQNRLTNMDSAGYGLHAQYCKVQILLRQALARPPTTRKRRYSQITSDTGLEASSDHSNIIIYQHALRIARLVVTYREAYGTEKMPSIMLDNAVVAATTMIRHLNKVDNVHEPRHQATWLRQLVKSMELVHPHFPIIGRMLDSLKQICESAQLRSMLPSARRISTDPSTQELPALSQPLDLSSTSHNARENSFALGFDPDMIWDFFDTNGAPDVFLSGKLGDPVFNHPPSEALNSNMPQTVP